MTTTFHTHGAATKSHTILERDDAPTAFVIKAERAHLRVLAALCKAFPDFAWEQALGRKQLVITGTNAHRRAINALKNAGLDVQPRADLKEKNNMPSFTEQCAALVKDVEDVVDAVAKAKAKDQHPYDAHDAQLDAIAEAGNDVEPDDDDETLADGTTPTRKAFGRSVSATAGANIAPSPTTKFHAATQRIAHERGLSKTDAQRAARLEHPLWFKAMQESGLPSDTTQTLVADPVSMVPPTIPMDKSANTYEALVQQEMKKGISTRELAAQRVCYAHPELARDHIAKSGDTITTRFTKAVSDVMRRDGVERTEAMRRVRKAAPDLFERFQEV